MCMTLHINPINDSFHRADLSSVFSNYKKPIFINNDMLK